MEYDKVIKGVVCNRDIYGEQFSDQVKINYMISLEMDVIAENENTKELAKQLKNYGNQLLKWANHFEKMKPKK